MRLIDAEILFEKVGNIKPKNKSEYELLGKFMNMITNSTTVERPHGEWIDRNGNTVYPFWERYECSKCGAKSDYTNFCPNCGRNMRKEGEAG